MAPVAGDFFPHRVMTSRAMAESTSTPPSSATSATTSDVPAFGWSAYAERVNGRFAMIGFVAVLVVEFCTHDTFLHWAGLVP